MNKIFVTVLVLAFLSATVCASAQEEATVKGNPLAVTAASGKLTTNKEGKEYVIEAWGRKGPVYPGYGSIYSRILYGGYFNTRPYQVQVSLEVPSPYTQKFSEGADKGYITSSYFDARVTSISGNLNGALIDYHAK